MIRCIFLLPSMYIKPLGASIFSTNNTGKTIISNFVNMICNQMIRFTF